MSTRGCGRSAGGLRGRKRILVVEDEPDLADLFRLIFRPAGYEVLVAFDLVGARAILGRAAPPDLVFLDVILPDGSGLDLVPELKAARPAPRVVVVTGDLAARNAAMQAGADRFVEKPFDPDALEAMVTGLL